MSVSVSCSISCVSDLYKSLSASQCSLMCAHVFFHDACLCHQRVSICGFSACGLLALMFFFLLLVPFLPPLPCLILELPVATTDGSTLESRIPMVLDSVIRSAREKASYGGPFISMESVSVKDRSIFIFCERPVLHLRAQLITPSQPAGFP